MWSFSRWDQSWWENLKKGKETREMKRGKKTKEMKERIGTEEGEETRCLLPLRALLPLLPLPISLLSGPHPHALPHFGLDFPPQPAHIGAKVPFAITAFVTHVVARQVVLIQQ